MVIKRRMRVVRLLLLEGRYYVWKLYDQGSSVILNVRAGRHPEWGVTVEILDPLPPEHPWRGLSGMFIQQVIHYAEHSGWGKEAPRLKLLCAKGQLVRAMV